MVATIIFLRINSSHLVQLSTGPLQARGPSAYSHGLVGLCANPALV